MSEDRDLGQRLRDVRVPDEDEAHVRSWEIVRTAYAEHSPAPAPRRVRTLALAIGGGLVVLVIGLSPAGAKVGDLVSDVVGIGADDAKPALRSLPAAGELLVESEQGPWIVREDGSKRLLGDYDEASWSPRGLFVAVAEGRELLAVDLEGAVRWSIDAPGRVRDPRWSPSGFRIAYRSGDDLRVVPGDGDATADKLLARDVAPVAPAWRPPPPESKLAREGTGVHVLTYLDSEMNLRTIDADTGATIPTTPRDIELLTAPSSGQRVGPATSPDGISLAVVRPAGRRTELVLRRDDAPARVLFSARGTLTGPTWSPDGHWLLVGLPEADQWLFIPTERFGRVVAVDGISEEFNPGGTGAAGFPHAGGWILPQR